MAKPVLQRTCIGCQQKKSKKDLLRLTLKKSSLVLDKERKSLGRGAYICKNNKGGLKKTCFTKALNKKSFNYAFRKKINIKDFEKNSSNSFSGTC
jgi:predicted RNA-binding protein YlxR (DUF448 family)